MVTVTLRQLCDAVQADWQGYKELHTQIVRKGCFFGNDDPLSNGVARQLYDSLAGFLHGKKNLFGYPFLVGDLLGYNEHHKWFGEKTGATPDGRHAGEMLKFGFGQSGGRDRSGLTALLNAIAQTDPHAIACGSTVTNISVDGQLLGNDAYFEKAVDLFETYFQNGGVHFQLNCVSKEELLRARQDPEHYRNLRVRVTGYSDYFVKLPDSVQQDVLLRTSHDNS